MTRLTLCLTLVCSLVFAAQAAAKEIVAAKVCGATDCREVKDERAIAALAEGGPPTTGPTKATGFYRLELTAKGEGELFTWSNHVSLSTGLMRGDDGTWMQLPPSALAAHRRVARGLEPLPARTFERIQSPPARVDEVVEPPAQPVASDSGGGVSVWPFAAGALVLLIGLAAWLRPRRLFRRDHLGLHDDSHHTRPAGT